MRLIGDSNRRRELVAIGAVAVLTLVWVGTRGALGPAELSSRAPRQATAPQPVTDSGPRAATAAAADDVHPVLPGSRDLARVSPASVTGPSGATQPGAPAPSTAGSAGSAALFSPDPKTTAPTTTAPTPPPEPVVDPRPPAPTVPPPGPTSPPVSPPVVTVQTFSSPGGTVTVQLRGDGDVSLVASAPAPLFSQTIVADGPDHVEVRYRLGPLEWRVRVDAHGGTLVPRITS
jgi:hypothetical protein